MLLVFVNFLAVEWGTNNDKDTIIGAAHAVEDSNKVGSDFCLDVVAGILELVRSVFLWFYIVYFFIC